MSDIQLNDAQIRGFVLGGVEQFHYVSTGVWTASHGGSYRRRQADDAPTPAALNYQAIAELWNPILKKIYKMPAAQELQGEIPDPRLENGLAIKADF
jgi:hypothetical protein